MVENKIVNVINSNVQYLNVNNLNINKNLFKNNENISNSNNNIIKIPTSKSNNTLSCADLTNNCKLSSDLLSIYSSTSIENLDENLWDEFQEHYEYLMDKGLIETCQLSGNQTNQNQNENISGTVSFSEFLHQIDELTKWLNQMKSMNFESSLNSCCEKYANQIFYEEILERSPRRKLLNEYARHLVKYHPHLKNDVLIKLHYLNKLWKSMEFSILYKRYYGTNIIKDLEQDVNKFENWLHETETFVDNLTVDRLWSVEEIESNLTAHKSLQTDIESHARIINAVLKLSSKLKQMCSEYTNFYEIGINLQDRWHCLWLKSLEWQCRLEQELTHKRKAANIHNFELKLNLNNSLSSNSTSSTSSTTTTASSITFDNNNNNNNNNTRRDFEFDRQEVRELREDELNGESEDEIIFINFDRRRYTGEDFSSSDSEKFEPNLTISPIYEEDEEELEEQKVEEEEGELNYDEDIIPFDEYEYEKIANSPTPTKSLTPTLSNNSINKPINSSNLKEMNRMLSNINQYYSLTDIKYYNIEDDQEQEIIEDDYYNEEDEQQIASVNQAQETPQETNPQQQHQQHQDIGYSSGNEQHIDSPVSEPKELNECNNSLNCINNKQTFYKIQHRKSFSDYYMNSKLKKQNETLNKYKKFFSRYSRSKIGNSDDDYVAEYEDDEFDKDDCTYQQQQQQQQQVNENEVSFISPSASSSLSSTSSALMNSCKTTPLKKYRIKNKKQFIYKNFEITKQQSSTTSAYDTSSNLSNEGCFNNVLYNKESHMNGENKDDSFGYDDNSTGTNDKINEKPNTTDILSVETNSGDSKPVIRLYEEKRENILFDETSTTSNTDMSTDVPMSDPHWDGYTSSSYFCNLNNDHNIKLNPPQPILPWDGIFFELESNEESTSKMHNQHYRKFRSTNSKKQAHHIYNNNFNQNNNINTNISIYNNYNSYLNTINNNNNNNKDCNNKDIISTSSITSLVSSSSSSLSSTSSIKHNNKQYHKNHRFNYIDSCESADDSEMEELNNILNDSIAQWNQARDTLSNNIAMNNLHIYNEILATCQTNISCLTNIKNSIDKCDKTNSKEYSTNLDDIINKWKSIEPVLVNKKIKFTKYLTMLNDIKTINNSLIHVNFICKEKNFSSIENLRLKINELERRNTGIIEYSNKLNELRLNIQDLDNEGMDVQNLNKQINNLQSFQSEMVTKCKVEIENLKAILCDWVSLNELFNETQAIFNDIKEKYQSYVNIDFNDFEFNFNLKLGANKLIQCENQLNKIKLYCDLSIYENNVLKLDKLKLEYNTLCQLLNENNYNMKEKLLKSLQKNYKNDNQSNSNKNKPLNELNMQLDLNDEFIVNENNNVHLTSTPRYKQDNKNEQNNQKTILRQYNSDILEANSIEKCDKSIATFDDNATQTDLTDAESKLTSLPQITKIVTQIETTSLNEIVIDTSKKNNHVVIDVNNNNNNKNGEPKKHVVYRSVDSGICGVLDNTVSEIQSSPSSLSHSFNKIESFDRNEDTENITENDEDDDEAEEEEDNYVDDEQEDQQQQNGDTAPEQIQQQQDEVLVDINEINRNHKDVRRRLRNQNEDENLIKSSKSIINNEQNKKIESISSTSIEESVRPRTSSSTSKSNIKKILLLTFIFLIICLLIIFFISTILYPSCGNIKKEYFLKYIFVDEENLNNVPTAY